MCSHYVKWCNMRNSLKTTFTISSIHSHKSMQSIFITFHPSSFPKSIKSHLKKQMDFRNVLTFFTALLSNSKPMITLSVTWWKMSDSHFTWRNLWDTNTFFSPPSILIMVTYTSFLFLEFRILCFICFVLFFKSLI